MHENDFNSEVVALIYKKLKRIPSVTYHLQQKKTYDVPIKYKNYSRANRAWQEHQDSLVKKIVNVF